jgi:hypothetical protein
VVKGERKVHRLAGKVCEKNQIHKKLRVFSMNIKEFIAFVEQVLDAIVQTVLIRPEIAVKGEKIKKYVPDVNGFIFVNDYKLTIENYKQIEKDKEYIIVTTRYEVEIRDKEGNLVQKITGELLSDNKA